MSAITTHILDISAGVPAGGIPVTLERETDEGWEVIGNGMTNDDGRLSDLLASGATIKTGKYRLIFDTETYFAGQEIEAFYPEVTIEFIVRDSSQHYHVPLLLSPFGYSTYRGS